MNIVNVGREGQDVISSDVQPGLDATQEGKFPVPLTVEEFRHHVLKLFQLKMRTIAFMTNEEAAWRLLGKPQPAENIDLSDTSIHLEDLGITYRDIQETEFAKCLESMYEYAYFGVMNEAMSGYNTMEYGTHFTLFSTMVHDLANSLQTIYWDQNCGSNELESAKKCYHFVEVANARSILETKQNFLYYDDSREEDPPSYDDRAALSIPQIALLSGMTENSVRAAANPKRANPLKTYSIFGKTRVAVEDAKSWLMEKGRYVEITRKNDPVALMKKRGFININELLLIINQISCYPVNETDSGKKECEMPKELLEKDSPGQLRKEKLEDPDLVKELAIVLRFPADLFSLRVKEVLAKEKLEEIERELETTLSYTN